VNGKTFGKCTRILITLCLVFISITLLPAQSGDYFQYSKEGRKGYWQVKTDPLTKSTEVTFYNQHGNVLYKEILKNKYLKLNNKNTQILNKQLACLTDNSLVASEIKSTELEASNKYVLQEIAESNIFGRAIKPHATGYVSPGIQYGVHPVMKTTTLVLNIENLAQERMIIKIKDYSGKILYTEQTFKDRYRRDLHLTKLPEGNYILVIWAKKQKLIQKFMITADKDYKQISLLPTTNRKRIR
jgi:hypothetical protein